MSRLAVLISESLLEREDENLAGVFVHASSAALHYWISLPPDQIPNDDLQRLTTSMKDILALSLRCEWRDCGTHATLTDIWFKPLATLFSPYRDEDQDRHSRAPFPHELIGALLSCASDIGDALHRLMVESWMQWNETNGSVDEWPCSADLQSAIEATHGDIWSSHSTNSEVRRGRYPPRAPYSLDFSDWCPSYTRATLQSRVCYSFWHDLLSHVRSD